MTGRNLEGHRWISRPRRAFTVEALTQRLIGNIRSWRDYPPSLRLWFWLIPALTAVLGGILRFVRLDNPHNLVFDETYYVKDGYSFLVSGYERAWPDKANDSFIAGNPGVLLDSPEYVVHPPVGKWMIAAGMWLFGPENSFGWRFGAALTGTLSIFLLALIAQKLFRSLTLGAVAGVLLAVDGHHLVMSRTSLLDIFLMFWILAAFGALLMDRDDGRRRLAARLGRQAAASADGAPLPAAARRRAVAGDPLVAAGRRRLPRPGRRHQVVRPVLPGRLRAADGSLGPQRAPDRGRARLDRRRHPQGRHRRLPEHRPGGGPGLPGHLDRLVPLQQRLLPALGRGQPLGGVGLDFPTRSARWPTTTLRRTSSIRA